MQTSIVIAHRIQIIIDGVSIDLLRLDVLSRVQPLHWEIHEVSHLLLRTDLGHCQVHESSLPTVASLRLEPFQLDYQNLGQSVKLQLFQDISLLLAL
jgi:hypothetical protein